MLTFEGFSEACRGFFILSYFLQLSCKSETISNKKVNNCTFRKPPTMALLGFSLVTNGVHRRLRIDSPQLLSLAPLQDENHDSQGG